MTRVHEFSRHDEPVPARALGARYDGVRPFRLVGLPASALAPVPARVHGFVRGDGPMRPVQPPVRRSGAAGEQVLLPLRPDFVRLRDGPPWGWTFYPPLDEPDFPRAPQ